MKKLQPLVQKDGLPRPGPINLKKAPKVARACVTCRELRKRCDGAKPCASCQGLHVECEYSGMDGRKKEDWKARVEALEQRNAYLEQLLRQRSSGDGEGKTGKPTPAQGQPSSSETSRSTTVRAGSSRSSGTLQTALSDDQDLQQLFYTAKANHPLLGPLSRQVQCRPPCENRSHRLPDESTTRRAVSAFFQCAATLFYVTTERKTNQLLEKVYHSEEATAQDVVEVAACAAIGSHYKTDEIQDEARAAFFYLATTGMNEAFEINHIQGIRIFILLCMSCIMDKSSNARTLIMSALNFARAEMEMTLQRTTPSETDDEYRRTMQTLIFLEGWLSFSLGYRNCLRKNETDLVHCTVILSFNCENSETLITRLIQSYMTRLVLLASEVQAEMALCQNGDFWSHADRLAVQLDQWYQGLPPDLHLAALSSPTRTVTACQEKALYLMHMLYIDSQLQLYCRLLKASQDRQAEARQPKDAYMLGRLFSQIPRRICDTYTTFAVQLARIASLLHGQELIMPRCWLVVCAVFDACIILLLGTCQAYFTDSGNSSLLDLPVHINTCLTVLRFCERNDIAAHRLLGLLDPILQLWRCLGPSSLLQQVRRQDENQMAIKFVLDDRSPEVLIVVRMTYQLLDLMLPTPSTVWV